MPSPRAVIAPWWMSRSTAPICPPPASITRCAVSYTHLVIGAGVSPETGFLRGSGIEVGDGIVVDRFLQTTQPNVFAAGDVANFFDPVFNRQHRIEHWDNAIKQGKLAARNMLCLLYTSRCV